MKKQNNTSVQTAAPITVGLNPPTLTELLGKFSTLSPFERVDLGNKIIESAKGELKSKLEGLETERVSILSILGEVSTVNPSTPTEGKPKGKVREVILAAGASINGKSQREIETQLGLSGIYTALAKLVVLGNLRKEGSVFHFVKP